MSRIYSSLLIVIILLCLGTSLAVTADSTPPWYAQGASVEASESMTHVQMVSEEVLLVVEKQLDPEQQWMAAGYMTGHVEATFVMRNQGTEQESLD